MASTINNNGAKPLFPTMTAAFQMPNLGLFLEAHRRNTEAVAEAMQCSMRGIQKAMMRQGEMVSRMVQDNARIGETVSADSPERRMQLQANLMTHAYQTSLENAREVRAILAEAEKEMSEIVEARVTEGFKELQSAFCPPERRKSPMDAAAKAAE